MGGGATRAPPCIFPTREIKASAARGQVSQIDSLVLHSPLPSMGKTLEAWRAMEEAVEAGLVRQLGVSNFKSLGQLRVRSL
jgi:diketogulonate reductase-like aldo/keto reductase